MSLLVSVNRIQLFFVPESGPIIVTYHSRTASLFFMCVRL